jgi:ATP-dependent RNA helicase CshB
MLHPKLASSLAAVGITHFTDIQQKALPTLLQGKTCLINSEPASGKTWTYLLPLLQQMYESPEL